MSEIESVVNTKESSEMKQAVLSDEENHCAAVQTRAMKVNEGKPQRPLKVTTVPGYRTLTARRTAESRSDIKEILGRFPTAFVRINTPYYKGTVKALCMENPVQELIVGNVPGAVGVEACYEVEAAEQREMIGDKHKIEYETQLKQIPVENGEGEKMSEIECG